jgi:tetratricopeptide (TPR) repeat protein
MIRWRHALAGACLAVAGAGDALAVEATASERRALGLRLASEGRCASALPELDAARAALPNDAVLALRAGECRLRQRDYAAAIRDLDAAHAVAPGTPEIVLALAKAHYHAGDSDAAQTMLASARTLEGDAEGRLYLGLLALGRNELTTAVEHLERALALDARRVEPVASFQLGKALARLDRTDSARTAYQRVTDRFDGTDWSSEATRALEDLESGGKRQAWLSLSAGIEHDSDVVLRGSGVPLPADISDEEDQRGVWAANLGTELWKTEAVTAGVMGSYRGTTHFDLNDFDSHFPSMTLWVEAPVVERVRALVRYDFGYAWYDTDPFVSTNSWQLSFARAGDLGATEVYGRAHVDEFFFESDDVQGGVLPADCMGVPLCGPAGIDESRERNRDGWGASAGVFHTLPLPTDATPIDAASLRGGYRYAHYEAEGREYTHDTHEATLGLEAELPLELGFDARGIFAYRPYRHSSTFPDPTTLTPATPYSLSGKKRRERMWQVATSVSRPITELVSVAARWRYTDNDSNTDVFDYDQHVLGVYLTLGLGREL